MLQSLLGLQVLCVTAILGNALTSTTNQHQHRVAFYVYDGPEFQWLRNCSGPSLEQWSSFKHGVDYWFARSAQALHPWRVTDPAQAELYIIPALFGYGQRHGRGCQGRSFSTMLDNMKQVLESSPYFRRNNGSDHLVVDTDYSLRFFQKPSQKELVKKLMVGHLALFRDSPWRCSVIVPMAGAHWSDGLYDILNAAIKTHKQDSVCRDATADDCVLELENTFVTPAQARGQRIANRPYTFFFRGQIDSRHGYIPRHMACVALGHVPGHHVCISSSKASKSVFKRSCSTDVFHSVKLAQSSAAQPTTTFVGDRNNETQMYNEAEDIALMQNDPHTLTTEQQALYYSQAQCNGEKEMFDYFYQLAHSKFCLMIRGDYVTSNRLFDCLNYGVLPVIISDGIEKTGLPFTDRIPWHKFCFFVKETRDVPTMAKALQEIADTDPAVLASMRHYMNRYYRDLVWHAEGSRVFENTLLSAYDHCVAPLKNATQARGN